MSAWVKQQGEIQGSYQIKVTTTALALLLSTRHADLGKINVQGHLVQTTAGITTRSKAKSAPEHWTVMPLNAKILALLADTLVEIQEQVTEHDDEDSDWEEVDAGDVEIDQDLLLRASTASRPTHEHLAVMAKVFENQNDGDEDELFSSVDPLNEINLLNYLVDFFVKFYQNDRSLFDQLFQSLTESQQRAIQLVLNQ